MLTEQDMKYCLIPRTEPCNEAWLAGACAGLQEVSDLDREWIWDEFLRDIKEKVEYADVKPIRPGEEPIISGSLKGSVLDALGGYVSVTGTVTPNGLSFPVGLKYNDLITSLLIGLHLKREGRDLTVPSNDLQGFLKLVPVIGPVADWLVEGGCA